MSDLVLVERTMGGMTALAIAHELKGNWRKRADERDTEHVRRIWETMREHMEIPVEGEVP